ncbi:ABC transporter substrate-binding protein [Pseudoduganella ginsengisoli]|uniref:Transporter substrate-binding domain-containing protein n=1 Tax=Pseudoduganella ginsengisoli TaxID=1462440 RepID=A0A6L6Q7S2_9BURK|nr:transporter substrate-binding domain-containing protein [Pseudoduganella ginsengisoli]MTW05268.1 transporter substrate-binding domain-containing protein [Pseudoduganella ginsengisoli]
MHYAAIPVLLAALSVLAAAPPAAAATPSTPSTPALPPSPAAGQQQAVTIYVDDAYPPYSYAVNGTPLGVYPAILARIFTAMPAYKVDLQPVPWKRGLRMLEQGEGFALAPPYYRPGDRPWMDYSAPIMLESVVMYCNDAVAARVSTPRWPDGYFGLRIGVNTGFLLGGPAFDAARRNSKLAVEEARGTDENLKKLLLGRIDCYMNDRYAIQHALLRARAENAFQHSARVVETAVVSQEHGYLGFTRLHGERWTFRDDFIRQFNVALEELRRSGELAQIAERELRR